MYEPMFLEVSTSSELSTWDMQKQAKQNTIPTWLLEMPTSWKPMHWIWIWESDTPISLGPILKGD